MKLDELYVTDPGARAESRGHSITRCNIRIGRLAVHVSEAARSQQNGIRIERNRLPGGRITCHHARHLAIRDQQVSDGHVARETDVRQRSRLTVERTGDFPARGIAVRVKDAVAAVRSFPREGKFRPLAVEFDSPVYELLDRRRAFFGKNADRLLVTKTVARRHGVLFVEVNFVVIT